jgi:hypothetical protein
MTNFDDLIKYENENTSLDFLKQSNMGKSNIAFIKDIVTIE